MSERLTGNGPNVKGIDWFYPPPPETPPPVAPQAMCEPAPAEIIADLDWIDVTRGYGGLSVSEKARKKYLDKMARDLTERGQAFIYEGVRHAGRNG